MNPYPVITLHGISSKDFNSPTLTSLKDIQRWLLACKQNQIRFETLESVLISKGTRLACLSFDDALTSILKVVEYLPSPGTIFVSTDYVGKTNRWKGQPSWVPEEKCLSWSQIKELSHAGWCIGAHSATHPDFSRCDVQNIRNEIEFSKKTVEDQVGQACRHFAYPYGKAPVSAQEIVEQSGMIGYGTEPGWCDERQDRKCLPRLDIYDLVRPGMASNWAWDEPDGIDLKLIKYKRWVGAGIRYVRRLAS